MDYSEALDRVANWSKSCGWKPQPQCQPNYADRLGRIRLPPMASELADSFSKGWLG